MDGKTTKKEGEIEEWETAKLSYDSPAMAVMLVKLEGAIAAISAYVAPASGYIEETWHDEDPATEGFVWDAYD